MMDAEKSCPVVVVLLRELLAKATPGEWRVNWRGLDVRSVSGAAVCAGEMQRGEQKDNGDWENRVNMSLIANMKNALPDILASHAAQSARIAELEDRVTNRDAKLVVQQGTYRLAMAGVRSELAAATARAEKAEARCEVLSAACRRQVENIEHWLETGEPAGSEESKAIYEQLEAALRAVEG